MQSDMTPAVGLKEVGGDGTFASPSTPKASPANLLQCACYRVPVCCMPQVAPMPILTVQTLYQPPPFAPYNNASAASGLNQPQCTVWLTGSPRHQRGPSDPSFPSSPLRWRAPSVASTKPTHLGFAHADAGSDQTAPQFPTSIQHQQDIPSSSTDARVDIEAQQGSTLEIRKRPFVERLEEQLDIDGQLLGEGIWGLYRGCIPELS